MYFDRNATQNGAKRSGSAGMDRRASPHRENWAAWVSPQGAECYGNGYPVSDPVFGSPEGWRAAVARQIPASTLPMSEWKRLEMALGTATRGLVKFWPARTTPSPEFCMPTSIETVRAVATRRETSRVSA